MSQFVHPGLFMLDGNNNFEDDSSVSEDFDAEWRYVHIKRFIISGAFPEALGRIVKVIYSNLLLHTLFAEIVQQICVYSILFSQ